MNNNNIQQQQPQQQQQPSLRLPNGNIIQYFQISNNVQFPVNYSIDNMATKLVQNEASRKIQDNLTKFMINYSNFKNINMSTFFNYNGTAIQPIIIYTFYTRENDFNKINWKPIIQRLNSSTGNTDGLIQKIETIWNSFMRPFSDWIHNDPLVKEEYRKSKLDIEKLIFDQKDKLAIKLQLTIREKYGINMPLSESLQVKVDHQMNLLRQQQQQQQHQHQQPQQNAIPQSTIFPTNPMVATPITANGKPPPKKRGRKSKKEKEAMLLAQQQQALMTGAAFPPIQPVASAATATPTNKKKKKLTKKEIEQHNKLLSQEINRQTAFLLQQHTQRTAKIPKVYKNKSSRNYTPIRYPLTPVDKETNNLKELQMLRQLEFLKPKLEPDLTLPLDISSQTLNSLLLLSQNNNDHDDEIILNTVEDLVQLADEIICDLLDNKREIVDFDTILEEEDNIFEEQTDNQNIKIMVDALTGVEVKPENEIEEKDQLQKNKIVEQEDLAVVTNDNSIESKNQQFKDTLFLLSQNKRDIKFNSLKDAFIENFFNLSKPIITDNFLQNICEDENYFKIMKLLTIATILRNVSINKKKFLALNYGYLVNDKIIENKVPTIKNHSKRTDSNQTNTTSPSSEETKQSSFSYFFKIFNKFLFTSPQLIIKHANVLTYTQLMKSWLVMTDKICEQLKFDKNNPSDVEFLQDLINNLKMFTSKNKVQFEPTSSMMQDFINPGTYVADIFMKIYYVDEGNSMIMNDLVLNDSNFIDDLVRLLMKECMCCEDIKWSQLNLNQFEELLPSLLQPLNCIQLLLQKKKSELSNSTDNNVAGERQKILKCLTNWITKYDLMNKLAILFQFSYKFMKDIISNENQSLPVSHKKSNTINKHDFLIKKY